MRWRSVRLRLTLLVVAVAALAMFTAATIGLSQIRAGLVDDVVDDTVNQTLFVDGIAVDEGLVDGIAIDEGFVDEGFVDEFGLDGFGADEFGFDEALGEELFFISEQMTELVVDLDRVGALDPLLAGQGRSRADGLVVLHSLGVVVIAAVDGGTSEVLDVDVRDFGEAVAFEFNLYDIVASLYEFGPEDFLLDEESTSVLEDEFFDQLLERRAEVAADSIEIEVTSAEIDGIEFVVVADIADVTRSVDKMRSVLWATMPLLVVFAAAATWFLTGRALSPVRRMSRQVGAISGGTLNERVPVPATGDEIEELGTTMNGMLDRLEADDQRLRQFVSDASHELRSPVAVLRSEAEVTLRSPEETDAAELAQGVLDESLRLERIVSDLLVLARGDEARSPARFNPIDLDDIVLAEASRRRRVPVDAQGVSAGRVLGTREGCERVLVHLLDNAARHAESRAAVSLHSDGSTVTLAVDDDGPGIPAADRDRIFERFTRLEEARTRDRGGAGLGLAVVAATVAAMSGRIEVGESPAGGARFTVTWPAAA